MMSALLLASGRLNKLRIPFQQNLLDGALCKMSFSSFHIFSVFLVLKRDFIRRPDFTRISASNTASDDATRHKLGQT